MELAGKWFSKIHYKIHKNSINDGFFPIAMRCLPDGTPALPDDLQVPRSGCKIAVPKREDGFVAEMWSASGKMGPKSGWSIWFPPCPTNLACFWGMILQIFSPNSDDRRFIRLNWVVSKMSYFPALEVEIWCRWLLYFAQNGRPPGAGRCSLPPGTTKAADLQLQGVDGAM